MNRLNLFVCLVLALFITVVAYAQPSADHAFVAPVKARSLIDAQLHPLPQATAEDYLKRVGQLQVYDVYAGRNAELEMLTETGKVVIAAEGFDTDLTSDDLFDDAPFTDGSYTVWESGVVSIDALALRLLVDLSALRDGDEVWVIDPQGPRAHGPYTSADVLDSGTWLATTGGDTAVLSVRSLDGQRPDVTLLTVSHFFKDITENTKGLALSCNNDVNCVDTDTELGLVDDSETILDLSTGVGRIVIPWTGGTQALCSGSLINNADTPELEGYFLSAWHCYENYSGAAEQIEVFWDYRSSDCDNDDPPALNTLPRSYGDAHLKSSDTYDMTLVRLASVPVGALGRTWLGWDASYPLADDGIIGIHHPRGEYMRLSAGNVTHTNQLFNGFIGQTRVLWYDGVTEGGSSGSPLLLQDSNYRITGVLSGGPTHCCYDPVLNPNCNPSLNNYDYYAALPSFFSEIQCWLEGDEPCHDPDPGLCPASKAFVENPEALNALRSLRDEKLNVTPFGRVLVKLYYSAAPELAAKVAESDANANTFRALSAPFVQLGQE
jgi:hypothetical protein